MEYSRWNLNWSSTGTELATAVWPTRIEPRSRAYVDSRVRRLSGRAFRSAAKTYWMRVVDTSSDAKDRDDDREATHGRVHGILTTSVWAWPTSWAR